jgi:hypothetical protein
MNIYFFSFSFSLDNFFFHVHVHFSPAECMERSLTLARPNGQCACMFVQCSKEKQIFFLFHFIFCRYLEIKLLVHMLYMSVEKAPVDHNLKC